MVSWIWVDLVIEDLKREFGTVNLTTGNVVLPKREITLDFTVECILRNATQPQRNDPQLLVGCAMMVYESLGWIDWFKPEAFRRQFQRVQLEQGMYAPDAEGFRLRDSKRAFVEKKNLKWKK